MAFLLTKMVSVASLSPSALKIMPMGDSITLGVGGGGYRDPLGHLLASSSSKQQWDYVGPLWDGGNHAGYNGWTIKQISTVSHAAVLDHQPDLITLMAGTNDFFFNGNDPTKGCNASIAIDRMRVLLDSIFDASPSITVLLSGVTHINVTLCAAYPSAPWHPPACPSDMQSNIDSFNKMLPALILSYQQKQPPKKISFHDPNNDIQWNTSDYFTWGIHFSETGYKKMADEWFKVLQPYVG